MSRTSPDAPGAHFDGREFHNLDGAPAGRSLIDVLRWKLLGGRAARWPKSPADETLRPALPTAIATGEMAATFVGHSTLLLQFPRGLNVLTDPIWSERASPVSFAGPRRARPPAVAFDALPPVHLVLGQSWALRPSRRADAAPAGPAFSPVFLTGLGNRRSCAHAAWAGSKNWTGGKRTASPEKAARSWR